ncbi:TolC family outer membrane protein [Methylosinus sp. LW3]|uniref:TolC family outer membrane protein n=1 Tax=Methylosinus sp. LW3 TaxID=107635 RepID=UPI000466FE0B|nr:TolC family outer membrane protein [Methylosinus sp. LW3]
MTRLCVTLCVLLEATTVHAETLNGALTAAYRSNPILHSGRAAVRAEDENVPRTRAQMRPRVGVESYLGVQQRRSVSSAIDVNNGNVWDPSYVQSIQAGRSLPRSATLSVEQPLFDGFRATNSTHAAEAGVFAARQRLRLTEQRVLLDGVVAYTNVLRDTAVLGLHRNNVAVLDEQLRQTRERAAAGQVTVTDVAQAEARLAAGRSQAAISRATLDTSIAAYRQVIGNEPKELAPARSADRLLPKSLAEAERAAQSEHPLVLAAAHDADVADLAIRIAEAEFLPSVSMVANVFTQSDVDGRNNRAIGAQVLGRLSVPIYAGGATSARIRQAKESAGQKRFDVDVARAELTASMRSNWSALQSASAQIVAARAQIAAAERALFGVREEAKAGLRTTLDILNAQRELLSARIGLIVAQRDRVVASYTVLAVAGRLSAGSLALNVEEYDPGTHFGEVDDKWSDRFLFNGR